MKPEQTMPDSHIEKILHQYYRTEVSAVPSQPAPDAHTTPESAETAYQRVNRLLNFALVGAAVLFIGLCAAFYEHPTPLQKAVTAHLGKMLIEMRQ